VNQTIETFFYVARFWANSRQKNNMKSFWLFNQSVFNLVHLWLKQVRLPFFGKLRLSPAGHYFTLFELRGWLPVKLLYEQMQTHPGRRATRREFLKKSTLAAAVVAASANIFKTPVYGQDQAPARQRGRGNNRLVVAYHCTGGQG